MAAEEKNCPDAEKQCCDPKKVLATLFKLVLGLIFLVLGGLAILRYWGSLLVIVQGCSGLFLILAGVITLAMAKE